MAERFPFEYSKTIYNDLPQQEFKICELMQLSGYKSNNKNVIYYDGSISFYRQINELSQFHLIVIFNDKPEFNFHLDSKPHKSARMNRDTLILRSDEIYRLIHTLSLLGHSPEKQALISSLKEKLLFGLGQDIHFIENQTKQTLHANFIRASKNYKKLSRLNRIKQLERMHKREQLNHE